MNIDNILEEIRFDERGLVPAVVQDADTKKVLMLAYMNKESIKKTLKEREACYYSRSRKELWKKGETSGNIQKVKGFYYDCDKDSILIIVEQIGVACHTGEISCFFNEVLKAENEEADVLKDLYNLLGERKENPIEGSYTNYLFEKGLDKILKKVGEETSEVIIGAKNKSKRELVYEISDLVYHVLVLMVNENINIEDIKKELKGRRKK
ncbi:MAG: bifunctional phosphoribosyl-AMP cyclohydrolase/phosphoribosyl-ATP diphosphatase HisIE [Lutispora sp.]|nr:bifunctional phosphoribosyl-AMP cyclohydrolase/phosphoribosyl-ATP diphosphatase HisIE [Lutispora sp.]MDD4834115.1 bifunctional phosphoribosyl-AMP cyclohydrolase/phosphoribosyl-ATP diphosphatase HisIE [Lutispora sp.]